MLGNRLLVRVFGKKTFDFLEQITDIKWEMPVH
jgi:hypothetical protein